MEEKELVIKQRVKTIKDEEYSSKKITSLVLNEGLELIGEYSFGNNDIKEVTLPSTLKTIGKEAFIDNVIEKLTLNEGLKNIEESAFENNQITVLNIPSTLEEIEDLAFMYNFIRELNIPSNIKHLRRGSFSHNNIEKIIFDSELKTIEPFVFQFNLIKELELPDSITEMGEYAFYHNKLTNVKLSKGLTTIENSCFSSNELTNIVIPEGVTSIGNYAFTNNKIKKLTLPSSILEIGIGAFQGNKLKEVEIQNGTESIDVCAFLNNPLKKVILPKSVKKIAPNAFVNTDIYYDGVLIKKDLVKKYGCENIIKLYEASMITSLDKIDEYINDNVFDVMPINNDSIKGYILNRKKFETLLEKVTKGKKIKRELYKSLFKMCFVLGVFNNQDLDAISFIEKIVNEHGINYVDKIFGGVKLNIFKPKFKDIFFKLYNSDIDEEDLEEIVHRLYNSFEDINKYTIKVHEEILSKKNTELIRSRNKGLDTTSLEKEIEELKKGVKEITYDDIVYYIKNHNFIIRTGNEALKSVENELSLHIKQNEFDVLQDIYEKSINVEKNIPLTKDISDSDIRYHWSKSDNPINLTLGYLVSCCAKLGATGEDIMRQSMINPDIANLIIYDENNQVIGKATAYYNRRKKYILFNNIETKVIKTYRNKSEVQRKKECLEAIIRGVNDAVSELKRQGKEVTEVRIGMKKNDLGDTILEEEIPISHKLLNNYDWFDYEGDANDINLGQAIIYKDEENLINKNI